MKKSTLGLIAGGLILIGGGCFATPPQPTPPSGPIVRPSPPPAPEAAMVAVDEMTNGQTLNVSKGDTIDLVLHSTYWQIQPTDSPVLKPLMAEPVVTGKLSNPPGMGTGTVEMKYQVAADGTAVIAASRTTCGEAMRCIGAEGEFKVTIVAGASAVVTPPAEAPKTVRVSEAKTTDYCDGAKMDSDGYRATITKEQAFTPAPAGASEADRLRAVLAASTSGMCKTVMTGLDVTVTAGVARIPPIDGWAGESITMCSCKPQVEANLLRQPGIVSVVWE